MRLKLLKIFTALAGSLAIVGAVNWGLVGLFKFDLVRRVSGRAELFRRTVYGLIGLSGLWLATQWVVSMASIATGVGPRGRTVTVPKRSIVGQRLPHLEGETLTGRKVSLPSDAEGKIALLVMGFSYDARWDVEDWVENFRDRFADRNDVTFYEMPMIGGIARLAAPMIDAGMRRGTPRDLQDHVVTVYAQMGPIRRALGASDGSDTWVYLIDRDGTVLFQAHGPWDEEQFAGLTQAVESATRPAPSDGQSEAEDHGIWP